MPRLERLKEELAIQKQLFFVSLAVIFGLTGWLATHLLQPWYVIAGGVLTIMSFIIFGLTRYRKMNRLLQEIEDD